MLSSTLRSILLTAAAVSLPLQTAHAQGGDSNADASAGFQHVVEHSKGVMIKVPRDLQGRENTNEAEIRVYTGTAPVDASTNLRSVWVQGTDASAQPRVSHDDVSRDSSTWGWYGGYGGGGYGYGYDYYGYGWASNYYYNWNPCYYGGYNNYYYYSSPYSYYYGGYSYYYYPSYW